MKYTFLGNSKIKKEIKIEVTDQIRLNIRKSINIINSFITTPFSQKYDRYVKLAVSLFPDTASESCSAQLFRQLCKWFGVGMCDNTQLPIYTMSFHYI